VPSMALPMSSYRPVMVVVVLVIMVMTDNQSGDSPAFKKKVGREPDISPRTGKPVHPGLEADPSPEDWLVMNAGLLNQEDQGLATAGPSITKAGQQYGK
jgi:hypothetical protein